MGKNIAVVSGKGGTGKTSFTACVSLALAAMGYSTLALDCDITLRNLDLALGLSDSAAMDFSDVLEGRCTLEQAADQVRQSSRRYAKRQLTWFRRNSAMHWLTRTPETGMAEILSMARQTFRVFDN